jgi:hypothetical protein
MGPVAAVVLVVLAGAAGAAVWSRVPAPGIGLPPLGLCLVVRNQVERVEGLVGGLLGLADALGGRCAGIVVVDEASDDGTWEVLARLERRHPGIKTLRWSADTGGGASVLEAASAACGTERILLHLARGAGGPEPLAGAGGARGLAPGG